MYSYICIITNYWGEPYISEPHHRRSTGKSVFLLVCLVGWWLESSLIWMIAVYIPVSTNLNTLMVH